MTRTIRGTMIDTETLSLGDRALIWEVAAVPFEIEILEDQACMQISANPLHVMVDYTNDPTDAFDISLATVGWTSRQRADDPIWAAWREMHFNAGANIGRMPAPGVAMRAPASVIGFLDRITGSDTVWFRNAGFDVPRIENLARQAGCDMPWHRRAQCDIYTMVNTARMLNGYEDPRPATADHTALGDCIGQIEQLCDIVGTLHCNSPSAAKEMHETAFET